MGKWRNHPTAWPFLIQRSSRVIKHGWKMHLTIDDFPIQKWKMDHLSAIFHDFPMKPPFRVDFQPSLMTPESFFHFLSRHPAGDRSHQLLTSGASWAEFQGMDETGACWNGQSVIHGSRRAGLWCTLWWSLTDLFSWKWQFIVSFPLNMVIFHSCVRLPDGN